MTDHDRTLPAGPPPDAESALTSKRHLFRPGDVIDNLYQIRGVIGEGGMGQVFEAYDPLLKRAVAIKAAWPHVDRGALHVEAQVLASLRHPSLVTVHSMGNYKGIDYIVLERLYGLTLRAHMARRDREHPFTIDEALDILVSISDALAYIHQNSVVHRDIKPDNIMLESNGRVMLVDFGLASPPRVHASPSVSGSPHYMAPETATGNFELSYKPTVDIYALGVIAFELLAGRKPFDGGSVTEILTKHLSELPPDISGMRGDVSEHLARLVSEMLAKDPDERPGSAHSIAMWLRALQRGRTLQDHGPAVKVLIVDDDPDMLHLMATCVEHAVPNAEIRTAVNGLDGVQQFHNDPPEILLFDLNMPEMSGIEMCMYLRGTRLADRTALIAVSAEINDDNRNLLKRLGVTDVLSKRGNSGQLVVALMELTQRLDAERWIAAPSQFDK